MSDDLGTLEAGKLADIVIIDGDPLADISNLLNVAVVVKGGKIVVDHRLAASSRVHRPDRPESSPSNAGCSRSMDRGQL